MLKVLKHVTMSKLCICVQEVMHGVCLMSA